MVLKALSFDRSLSLLCSPGPLRIRTQRTEKQQKDMMIIHIIKRQMSEKEAQVGDGMNDSHEVLHTGVTTVEHVPHIDLTCVFTPDALQDAALPFYPGWGPAPGLPLVAGWGGIGNPLPSAS
ncbi:hypothetical protein EXN66_Car013700 [Channa argus]|uniref:Uncharacterized protein n=1 Tax=Channa argus TaxID=215402 RepID=A0A6G1Q6G3_CHAAH|nr:hypothetical protein EXN66_Car013700 [Channa argus]